MQPHDFQSYVLMSSGQKPVLHPSPELGAWLYEQRISIALSTYQFGRVFLISGSEDGRLMVLERIVGAAMGLAVSNDSLWIANKDHIWRFVNTGPMAQDSGTRNDAVYVPRQGYATGLCDIHDLLANVSCQGQHHDLLFVNTAFSCICAPDPFYSFKPVWKPPFISSLGPGDRCHLNGMCAREGQVAYVTACAQTDQPGGWRAHKANGGVVVDVAASQVIAANLSMPHSPRWHDNKLWLLNSGCGQAGYVDMQSGVFQSVAELPGFTRGLSFSGHHGVVGLSRVRESALGSGMPLLSRLQSQSVTQQCGLVVFDTNSGVTEHWLTFDDPVTELYDVAILRDIVRPYTPGFSNPELSKKLFNVPDDLFVLEYDPYSSTVEIE